MTRAWHDLAFMISNLETIKQRETLLPGRAHATNPTLHLHLHIYILTVVRTSTMSLPRQVTYKAATVLRTAVPSFSPASRRCPHCFRTFASYNPSRQSPRRQLQTASAYHPSTLGTEPLPPRNAGVPDTSIAGRIPAFNGTRPPATVERNRHDIVTESAPQSNVSIPEGEAQKGTRVGTSEASASTPSKSTLPSARPRRFKFGPRKATITLSQAAVAQLRQLLDQPEPKFIRIGTKAKGCSGLAYDLQYVDKPGMLDETVEQDGVKVLIDNKALINIIGSEMDWVEDKLQARFVFKNPNISKPARYPCLPSR